MIMPRGQQLLMPVKPGFIVFSIARLTSFGAAAPGTSTAPITMSASRINSSVAARSEYCVVSRPMKTSSR